MSVLTVAIGRPKRKNSREDKRRIKKKPFTENDNQLVCTISTYMNVIKWRERDSTLLLIAYNDIPGIC